MYVGVSFTLSSLACRSDEGVELPVPLSVDADSPMPPPPFGMLGRFLQFMSHANDTTASVTDGETATTTESNMSPESMLAEVSNIFSTMMVKSRFLSLHAQALMRANLSVNHRTH